MITDQEKFKKILPLLGKWLIPVSLLVVSQANYTLLSALTGPLILIRTGLIVGPCTFN